MPSDEARRRILAGEPVGSGAGQSPARTQAVAPLLAGFPAGTTPTSNPLVALLTVNTHGEADREHVLGPPRPSLRRQRLVLRAVPLQQRRRRHAGPHRDAAPRAREAAAAEPDGQLAAHHGREPGQRVQGRLQPAAHQRDGLRPGGLRSGRACRCRARSPPRPSTRAARRASRAAACSSAPRAPRRPPGRCSTRCRCRSRNAITWNARPAHDEVRRASTGGSSRTSSSSAARKSATTASTSSSTTGRTRYAVTQDSPVFEPQQYYLHGLRAGHLAAGRAPDARPRPALRLLLGRQGGAGPRQAVLRRGERVRRGSEQLLRSATRTTSRRACRRRTC